MPTPSYHGGAPIAVFPLNFPAFKGLNKQAKGAVLGTEWATRLENTVLDDQSRVAARKGWSNMTTTPAAQAFSQLFEYNNSGTYELIAMGTSNIYKSADDGSTWSSVTGTATITDTDMQFVVFNDIVLGFQNGGTVITYSGTSFSDLGATGEPTGGIALAAFGRVWGVDSTGVAIKYCALLDHTDWTGTDAGSVDLTSVWPTQDVITALAEFNGSLVIFGKKHIVIYNDGAGSALGIDPTQMIVVDMVSGIGCIARDTVVNVKGQLWFLDDTGIQTLERVVQERSNPLINVSYHVQDQLKAYRDQVTSVSQIKAIYSPADRFYLLSLPLASGSSEAGVAVCFDTRGQMEDGTFRCTGVWNSMVPIAMVVRDDLTLVSTLRGTTGEVGSYSTYQDDGADYFIEYESGWSRLNDAPYVNIIKQVEGLLYVTTSASVTLKWSFDFDEAFRTRTATFAADSGGAEFGSAEFNIGEYGGGITLRKKKVAGGGYGEYVKVGLSTTVTGFALSLQQLKVYAKQGRVA